MDWITVFRALENEALDDHEGVVIVFRHYYDDGYKANLQFSRAYAFEDIRLKQGFGQGMDHIWSVVDAHEPHPGHGLDNALEVGEIVGMFTAHISHWRMMTIAEQN